MGAPPPTGVLPEPGPPPPFGCGGVCASINKGNERNSTTTINDLVAFFI